MIKRSWWDQFLRKKSVQKLHDESSQRDVDGHSLHKSLNLLDLTCFGIAAVVGAGIFSTLGKAAADGGPAVAVLFLLTAVACLFSALCYSEFASRIPVSGSAYTYSYVVFGELIAWLIGWNLLMEYAIGNSVVAFSWSDYFSNLLDGFGIPLPDWLEQDSFSCQQALSDEKLGRHLQFTEAELKLHSKLIETWNNAPMVAGWKIIVDLPALMLNLVITTLVYIGIHESKMVSNAMVFLKLSVVMGVILIGAFYVTPANWTPFAPNGAAGVLKGTAAVFFTYIGFDAISTTAEECKNPKRDLPLATMLTLAICTAIYMVLAFVLTGMVNYAELRVDDPLAVVFTKHNLNWLSGIVSLSAVVAMASVFLVFQLGQPRIFLSMSRDGLLPKRFSKIHRRFKTPSFSTVVTGFAVALPIVFLNSQLVTDLSALGTLFAFVLVSGGILALNATDKAHGNQDKPGFRVPYINGKYIVVSLFALYTFGMNQMPVNHRVLLIPDWSVGVAHWPWEKFPYLVFYLVFMALAVVTWWRRWSVIPVLGVITNLYLIAGIGHWNWLRFAVWCLIGLVVYFIYSYRNSRLAPTIDRSIPS
jgi:basic amino acid/polyamine antiporter, APA family